MSAWQTIGLIVTAYLALLARNAWRQGELRQFLVSLAVVAALLAALAAIVWVDVLIESR